MKTLKLTLVLCLLQFSFLLSAQTCDNWGYFKGTDPGVQIGDLDIPGDKITVEALFNRDAAYDQTFYGGDVVSKHQDPSDVNYLLRPTRAEITTTTGYHSTPDVCNFKINKTYHVALVYDGKKLKFYRNGFLMSETPCTGNMILNDWLARIGSTAGAQDINPSEFHGYINEVRIWKMARTQSELRSYMNQSLPNPSTQTGLLAYYTFDDLKNKQGNSQWDGSILNNASINQTNPQCTLIIDSCATVVCNLQAGFTYKQNICDPLTIQFQDTTVNADSTQWDFGNGQTDTARNPIIKYTSYGNYTVQLIVKTIAGCTDTISKIINVSLQKDSAIITNDTTICAGSSVKLKAVKGLSYCWSPSITLSDSSVQNPVATPTSTTIYYLNSQTLGKNLVVNGNFSDGNTGFSSEYDYQPPQNINEGVYWIGTNPNIWNGGMSACTDHTGRNGNMMMVNGAVQTNINVWKQTITVLPNTNYAFSTWIQSVYPQNPAQLQFSINGKLIGNTFNANNSTCIWEEFYSTWNSGNSTSATISIVNMNSIKQGNDFALDDISFSEYDFKQDSVIVTVVNLPTVNAGNDTSICKGLSVQLNATGAINFNWNATPDLSDTNIANPIASPLNTEDFIVTGYNSKGCFDTDTVKVTVLPSPVITLTNDTNICIGDSVQLQASTPGNNTYKWIPATGLSDPNIANPIASPVDTTKYFVTVTDVSGCSSADSVTVNVLPRPTVSTINDTSFCQGATIVLKTTASNASIFKWIPVTGLSNNNIQNPLASPLTSTLYTVTAGNGYCNHKDSVLITVLSLPNVDAGVDTTLCGNATVQLNASGAISYTWIPTKGLSDPNIPNPIASSGSTTVYYVTGTGNNACTNTDSVKVTVKPAPDFTVTPKNPSLCKGDSVLLMALGGDSYSWLPVATVSDPSAASTEVYPDVTTSYQVTITNSVCKVTKTLMADVTVKDTPAISISKSNDIDCINFDATLTATGGVSYKWTPSKYISNIHISNPVVNPPTDTWYYVSVIGNNGCKGEDSELVKSIVNLDAARFDIPSAFTPNHDGLNDCFGVKYWGPADYFNMEIYDRWGYLVYHSNILGTCWDGTIRGIPQASGTYVYKISISSKCSNGLIQKKGTIVLIR